VNTELINSYKDTGCFVCGYNRCKSALHLHHVEEKNKKIAGISQVLAFWSPKEILTEMKKCVVLCSNCHSELHSGILNIGDEYKSVLDQFLSSYLRMHSLEDYKVITQQRLHDQNLTVFLEMLKKHAPISQKQIIQNYSQFVGISQKSAYRHLKILRESGKVTVSNRTVYI